jgi:hypothetical protein
MAAAVSLIPWSDATPCHHLTNTAIRYEPAFCFCAVNGVETLAQAGGGGYAKCPGHCVLSEAPTMFQKTFRLCAKTR